MDLVTREYRTIHSVAGPLVFVEGVRRVTMGEMVEVLLPDGSSRRGQVIEFSDRYALVQILEQSTGIDVLSTRVRFSGSPARTPLSLDILGRRFDGAGNPIDGLPPVVPETWREIGGTPINPVAREKPSRPIVTGISAIDGLNTLVRGQKLPIFSAAGLPAREIAAQILRQAGTGEGGHERSSPGERFAVVFAAMGITFRQSSYFLHEFEQSGAAGHTIVFQNLADDPTIERLLTPRFALTAAEYLAFDHGFDVLVILTDMTNYCDALREIATAREEIPGRRSYPGYMYTDLASIYERAGCIRGKKGSVTQLPILTMPDDDITHPVPDLTGYITEGQIVLSRDLHRGGVYPPIDVLPSLSRLMNLGIGPGKTREDHRGVADQLYAFYAQGRDLRRLEAIVGEEGLAESDRRFRRFADAFEREFIGQGKHGRTIEETLEEGWKLLRRLPKDQLTRIRADHVGKHYGSAADPAGRPGE
ncbi:MAG: V-type ATP synthase subunit B [bacterium]|nr:V-type ATP synthase subunit B [bacterium]